jgi:hypothetical protein
MVSCLVSVILLAGPAERGISFDTPVDLVTQVEAALPGWLNGKGLRENLATEKELVTSYSYLEGVDAAQAKRLAKDDLKAQKQKPAARACSGTRSVVRHFADAWVVAFFAADGQACATQFLMVPPGRLVVVRPPATAAIALEKFLKQAKTDSNPPVLLDKKDGQWVETPIPMSAEDCEARLKSVATRVFNAERAWERKNRAYTNSLEKLGLTAEALDGATVTFPVATADAYTASVSFKGGVVTIDEGLTTTVVKACVLSP